MRAAGAAASSAATRDLRARVVKELRRVLPAEAVIGDARALDAYGRDKWFAAGEPLVAALPASAEEAAAVFEVAARREIPVTPRGAGYGYVGGCVPARGGIVIGVGRMAAIREISRRDFVAVCQPGTVTGKLQQAVRRRGLYYPPDPASLNDSTIGGNIATNAGGPKCLKYGVTRNYVLGLEVVLADGTIVRCGGRTHKNKTGFDLVGLFVGSEGLLGFVTEATLRLLPHPPARAALSAGFAGISAAARAIDRVFREGFLPAALEVADAFTLESARKFRPCGRFPPGNAQVLIEVDGQPASVREESRALEKILVAAGATAVLRGTDEAGCEAIWDLRRAYSESLKATGLRKLNEDVAVPRGRLVDLVRFAAGLQRRSGFPVACFGHAGDGNIHVNIMVGEYADPEIRARAERALDELFEQVVAWGGAITGEHGIGLAKKPWWPLAVPGSARELHRRIKAALDPCGRLNPGKFV